MTVTDFFETHLSELTFMGSLWGLTFLANLFASHLQAYFFGRTSLANLGGLISRGSPLVAEPLGSAIWANLPGVAYIIGLTSLAQPLRACLLVAIFGSTSLAQLVGPTSLASSLQSQLSA